MGLLLLIEVQGIIPLHTVEFIIMYFAFLKLPYHAEEK